MIKFTAGQIIKNYVELCKIFNFTPTKSNMRKWHIKELDRYCTWHKEGWAFVVDEPFDKPLPKVDGRKNNGGHSKYGTLIDELIIQLVQDTPVENQTFADIFTEYIILFSDEYKALKQKGYDEFANDNGLSKNLVSAYVQKMNNIVKQCFESSLKRLHNQGVIKYSLNTMIEDSIYGKSVADKKTVKKIKECEKIVLEQMGITHFNRFINKDVNYEFIGNVCNMFSDSILYYYKAYSIGLADANYKIVDANADELIIKFLNSIHKSIENKTSNINGEKFKPYRSEKHKVDTYKLDKLLWWLPDNWHESFIKDYHLIFPNEFNDLY